VQSLCRDPSHREILFDLQQLREKEFSRHSKSVEFDLLSKTYSNLLRMFADP
jgi:PKHD-type hydroxylase